MSLNNDSSNELSSPKPIYGFMDHSTNTFYAFQNQEEYQLFLEMLKQPEDSSEVNP